MNSPIYPISAPYIGYGKFCENCFLYCIKYPLSYQENIISLLCLHLLQNKYGIEPKLTRMKLDLFDRDYRESSEHSCCHP